MNDFFTAVMKSDLEEFLNEYEATQQSLRENPYRPLFGQWPHTLELREPPNLDFTDPEDPAGQPDDHYYLAAGQEPPTAAPEGFKGSMLRLWHNREFAAILAVIAWLFIFMLVFGN